MLYLIGLGLNSKKSVSVEGLEAIKESDFVFLENYTSIIDEELKELEEFYGKNIILAPRDLVETNSDEILDKAKESVVSFLVVGDIFSATTHHDLLLRAKEKEIKTKIFHNASILNAVGSIGFDLYKFGKTTSIVFPDNNWLPKTPYDVIKVNKNNNMHTLLLLDIKVAEPSKEDLLKGVNKPQPPRFMSVNEAIEVLLRLEKLHEEEVISEDTLAIGVARLTTKTQKVLFGKLKDLKNQDFGKKLHSLIIPSKLSDFELSLLKEYEV